MRFRTLALLLIGGMFAGIWDASFVSWLPSPLSACRIVLPIAIILTLFVNRQSGIVFAIVGGCVSAILLPSTGGWIAIRYVACVIIAHLLSRHVFANRTLFGVIMLGALAAVGDRLLRWIFETGTCLLTGVLQTPEAHGPMIAEIFWSACIVAVAFLSLAAFTRRFLPTISHFTGRQIR